MKERGGDDQESTGQRCEREKGDSTATLTLAGKRS